MKLSEAVKAATDKKENRGVLIIRRLSWPAEDYLQILPDGNMSYWNNTDFSWEPNFKIPLKDVSARDWIVL